MKFLRRISTRELVAVCASVVVLVIGAAVIAMATTTGGPKPAPKRLPVAVHDALAADPVQGVSARIQFTNNLVDSSSVEGADPLLTGASGRLWAGGGGRLRLELQADTANGGVGDTQVLVDHNQVTVYDSGANAVYKARITQGRAEGGHAAKAAVPSVAEIERTLKRLTRRAIVSGAIPSDVAGRPAYTVHVSPRDHGGLLGGAELAWDAVHGTPLRAAVYAKGSSSPVLELTVTDISFGPVSASAFDITPPASATVTNLSPPKRGARMGHVSAPVTGAAAVARRTPFRLAAPRELGGLARGQVRLISAGSGSGALITYGRGLGGIAVLETPAKADARAGPGGTGDGQPNLKLPTVSINGAAGEELNTALGTIVRFSRGGVEYTVVGSVPPAVAEAAARHL